MANRSIAMTDELYRYLCGVSVREPEILQGLREETARLPMAMMQIGPEQGQFMAFLLRLIGARRCLEVGTFTGYSALVCAMALPPDGKLTALDVSREWTDIARRYWATAGLGDRIDLRLGPAAASMEQLLIEEGPGSFDFIFVDADKTGYSTYLELGLQLIRRGGLMAFDNVLWNGRVADAKATDADTRALQALNLALHRDERVDLSMVPIGDGLTLIRRR